MTSFLIEFPDYDAAYLPTLPEGFVDQSWHNDACPSFGNEALKLDLYIDYFDPTMRECGEGAHRFCLISRDIDADVDVTEVFSSNDWDEMLAFLAGYNKREG